MTRELQDKITGFWSAVADGYEAHAGNVSARSSEEQQAWAREIADLLPPAPADVLDVGTGTGFVAMIAAALGHRVTAIDLAEPMLAIARAEADGRRVTVTFATGDAVAPAFAAASFDAIISRHLIWTLRDVDVALTAWRQLLRPGGRVVAIDGFWFTSGPEDGEGLFESFTTGRRGRACQAGATSTPRQSWRCSSGRASPGWRPGRSRRSTEPRRTGHHPSLRTRSSALPAEPARQTRRHILWGARTVSCALTRRVWTGWT
jgi:SAM-dependent methyltransferase